MARADKAILLGQRCGNEPGQPLGGQRGLATQLAVVGCWPLSLVCGGDSAVGRSRLTGALMEADRGMLGQLTRRGCCMWLVGGTFGFFWLALS